MRHDEECERAAPDDPCRCGNRFVQVIQIAPTLDDYLLRYVKTRGIEMPHYDTGSKIIEEAYELQEAVQQRDRTRVMEEAFDVFITALVAVRQFGATLEEAAELKINKDKGRGEKAS